MRRDAKATRRRLRPRAGGAERRTHLARLERPEDVGEHARDAALRFELSRGGVGGGHCELGHDEDRVLLALEELLAKLMGDERALGGRPVGPATAGPTARHPTVAGFGASKISGVGGSESSGTSAAS